MVAKPRRESQLINLATGESQHQGGNLFFWGLDSQAIQAQEYIHALERDRLVSIYEGVIPGHAKPVGGSQAAEIRFRLVMIAVSWAIQSGF